MATLTIVSNSMVWEMKGLYQLFCMLSLLLEYWEFPPGSLISISSKEAFIKAYDNIRYYSMFMFPIKLKIK